MHLLDLIILRRVPCTYLGSNHLGAHMIYYPTKNDLVHIYSLIILTDLSVHIKSDHTGADLAVRLILDAYIGSDHYNRDLST